MLATTTAAADWLLGTGETPALVLAAPTAPLCISGLDEAADGWSSAATPPSVGSSGTTLTLSTGAMTTAASSASSSESDSGCASSSGGLSYCESPVTVLW